MADVYNMGTAKWLQIPGVDIAGKTGTVENYTRIEGVRTQLTDHSLFVAFAPVETPEVAISVIAENVGHGGATAAPVAKTVLDGLLVEPAAPEPQPEVANSSDNAQL